MKTSRRTLLLPVLIFFSAMALPAPAAEQPRMTAAVELLQRAREAREPVPLLRAAKKELAEAHRGKAGFRVEAIKIIDRAIAEGELGHRGKMAAHIDTAITAIRDGMASVH